MGIGIDPPRHGGHDGVVVGHARKLQRRGIFERTGRWTRRATTSAGYASRREVLGEVILRHDLERLVKDLPQLDGLVVCREEVMRRILPSTPFYLVDLLFDL